ncbi:carbohydrate kinase, partial [Klebsiella pneumoniae]|nr:carbohydrate kinase [Klebsiella pneumoniae]
HTGDSVAWMADSTGLSELSAAELGQELNTLPASVDSTLGVYFLPALTGLGETWWEDSAGGVICGLRRGVKRANQMRAA